MCIRDRPDRGAITSVRPLPFFYLFATDPYLAMLAVLVMWAETGKNNSSDSNGNIVLACFVSYSRRWTLPSVPVLVRHQKAAEVKPCCRPGTTQDAYIHTATWSHTGSHTHAVTSAGGLLSKWQLLHSSITDIEIFVVTWHSLAWMPISITLARKKFAKHTVKWGELITFLVITNLCLILAVSYTHLTLPTNREV